MKTKNVTKIMRVSNPKIFKRKKKKRIKVRFKKKKML